MPDRKFPGPDTGELGDDELLRRAREGDPVAFAFLIRRHDRSLYRVARSVLLNDPEAEDVVQETYLRAVTKLAGFAVMPGFRPGLRASLSTRLFAAAVGGAPPSRSTGSTVLKSKAIGKPPGLQALLLTATPSAQLPGSRYARSWNEPSTICPKPFAPCS